MANTQSGLYLDVPLPWPSSPALLAQTEALLAAHPGRSLALTVAAPMRPLVQWRQSPQALNFTSSPIAWRCGTLSSFLTSSAACRCVGWSVAHPPVTSGVAA